MRIITLVTQKGGAGKTTLAVNCAIAAERRKKRVLILDLDPQASSEGWYQDREAESPRLARIESWSLPEAIAKAQTANFDYVVIDTPGRDEPFNDRRDSRRRFLHHPVPTDAGST